MARGNEKVGTCPCIAKGCDLVADVFAFKGRAQSEGNKRFGGKVYARCEAGHQFGRAGDSQDYIEANTTWLKHEKKPAEPASAPVAAPVERSKKPASAPVQPQRKAPPQQPPKAKGFGFFR